jgi:hypothetical protein
MILLNHADSTFGLKADAHDKIDRRQRSAFRPRQKILDLGRYNLFRVTRPNPRLCHRRGVDVELDRRSASGEHIAGEIRRYVDDERISAGIHERHDVPFGNRLRRLEIGWQEGTGDPPRQFRVVLVDDPDGRVVHFLGTALRLRDDRK